MPTAARPRRARGSAAKGRAAGAAALALAFFLTSTLQADAIDDYLRREMELRTIPGLALAVVRGEAIEQRFYGLANLETPVVVGESSIFAVASLDKQLTAAGVVKLVELGRAALDDPLTLWVEGLPGGITLRQLLSHTSGLPDAVAGGFEGRSFTDYSSEQLLATVRGLSPLAPPGERFAYSDAGLFLAQLASEQITGESWWEFMRRELFRPAGMDSVLSLAPAAVVPGRVAAYTFDAAGRLARDRRTEVDYGPLYNDLGMTVGDFARWLAALDRGTPLSAAGVAEMTTPTRLADGRAAGEIFQWSRYGLGVGLDDLLGEKIVLHSGHSGVGFVRFPARRLAVVVFTNLEHPMGSDPVSLAIRIAGLLDPALDLVSLPRSDAADETLVARFRGAYEELLTGRPDLERYAPPYRTAAWEGAGGLAGRAPRFGALERFELVRAAPLDGEPSLLFRAAHERATVYWRISLDPDGRISRLVWWHF